ncbi:hypothetical protein BZ425_15380 [Salmonella enterica subsp. enterica serovar Enteritidis]|jgi:hypothetical protein|nr:hypothetical protein [Salmonella enterica subsp. enterica serovar Kentucky]EAA6445593.1 hypothetical protein [Salmonella enterica subsp. enterica serovar Weltevreden]EBY9123259.1 hypothetical protein [Salmonella enterica subsp. enterica serovar Virchow]EDF0871547.1 hypothetical protein [Salmonella enterica subsp. enterica serovar Enteritidis]HAR9088866.1 hypothetical protein [Salmonella enterica]
MANFAKTRAARESMEATATVVPDGIELPAESVEGTLADIEHDTKPIEALDADAELLAEDGDETDAQLDVLDEAQAAADGEGAGEDGEEPMDAEEDMPDDAATALDVAQESIRSRWNFEHRSSVAHESYGSRNRRQVARESLWEDIKAFLKRIWEWLKEQGRKIKDRWLKFSNQGKSIQARSKKYDEAIRKLGKQKKDEISGGFIKSLSIDGKFVGDDLPRLKNILNHVSTYYSGNVQSFLNNGTDMVGSVVKGDGAKVEKLKADFAALAKEDVSKFKLGNMALKMEYDEEGGFSSSYVEAENRAETNVKTPSVSELAKTNAFFNEVGKQIEKNVLEYRKTEQAREKFSQQIEKLLKEIDSVKIDEKPQLTESVRTARRYINSINQAVSLGEKVISSTQKHLAGGLNGYISAGIAAYEKSK